MPPPSEVIQLYNQNNIRRMRLYDPNQDVLRALKGTNIELILDALNDQLGFVASSQANADSWVRANVVSYVNDVRFQYTAVGNEVEPNSPAAPLRRIFSRCSTKGTRIRQNWRNILDCLVLLSNPSI
ncbi:Probable glucan endo-1,3-beta-glucosidase BG3 [Linum perenne]